MLCLLTKVGPAPSPQTIFSALTPLRSPVEITDNQSTSASSATMFKDNTNLLGILEPDSQDEEQCSYAQVSVLSDLERVMDTVMGIE